MTLKKTKLLEDSPTSSDAFGTHKRIADLIADEIVEAEEGRSIALVGDWGSGKSSVVEILDKKLDGDTRACAHVFIYDAWSHQGDSLRRAFLDDFITSLAEILDKEDMVAAAKRVWNRTEETRTTREPVLRRHAKIMLLGLALVPLGMQFFQIQENGSVLSLAEMFSWNNILAIFLISTPVLLALIFGALNCVVKEEKKRRFLFGESAKEPNFSVLSFFFEKVQGTNERREIKSPVDSIGTFREVFADLVNKATSKCANLRIVIVIDNIDRIPSAEAREFWSTMQTFFSHNGGLRQPQGNKYWLVAPFSVEALSFVFGHSPLGDMSGKSKNEDNPLDASEAKRRAKAYIDKTFGLAFYVPPPILSNWRKYFFECLTQAFVEHTAAELEAVRDVYDFGRTSVGFITPRDIKLFVNSLVALYRQRGDGIPLTMMVSYLLHKEEITGTDIPEELVLPQERLAIGEANWRPIMAALHFGVGVEEGAQLLLHEPIVSALRSGDSNDLQKLEMRPGFSDVLRKAVVEALGTARVAEGTFIARIAETLDTLNCSSESGALFVWRDMNQNLRKVDDWSGLEQSSGRAISIIIQHTDESERSDLCRVVSRSLSRARISEGDRGQIDLDGFAKNWALTAQAVVEDCGDVDDFVFDVPSEERHALAIVKSLSALEIGEAELSAFQVKTPRGNISMALADDIRQGNTISSPHQFLVRATRQLGLELEWTHISGAVADRMQMPELEDKEVLSHLGLLLSAYGYEEFPRALNLIRDLSLKGHLSHLYNRHRSNKDVCALILTSTLLANPAMGRQQQIGESPQGDVALNTLLDAGEPDAEVASDVASVADRSGVADMLYGNGAKNEKVQRFIAAVIGSLVGCKHSFGIEPEVFMEHWEYIEKNSDLIPAADLLRYLKAREGLLSFVAEKPFDPVWVGFYRASIMAISDRDTAYGNFLKEGIGSINKDLWQRALTEVAGSYSDLIDLVSDLRNAGRDVQLQTPAKDAVHDLTRKVARGELDGSANLRERLSDFIGLLDQGPKASLGRDIEDDMVGYSDADHLIRVVELVGNEISLQSDSEKIVRRLFGPVLSRPTERTLDWIHGIVKDKGESFWSLPSDAKAELEARLRGVLQIEGQPDGMKQSVREIAALIDIDLDTETSEQAEGKGA